MGGGASASPLFFCKSAAGIEIAAHRKSCIVGAAMERILMAALLAAIGFSASSARTSVLHDPVALNIGINCQWQSRCIAQQRSAMKRALGFVAKARPPQWRIQLCNRNASRGGNRVDWLGFDHCIRNSRLREPASVRKRRR
jgi:hypothetical protein